MVNDRFRLEPTLEHPILSRIRRDVARERAGRVDTVSGFDEDSEFVLRRRGDGRPAFRQFVLKVHGRCNLACAYCIVYTQRDQSWRSKPARIAHATVAAAAGRVAEHARHHRLPDVQVVFHGGEPLLAGLEAIAWTAAEFRRAAPAGTAVHLSMQTNGSLLRERALPVLLDHRIRVGISVDGGAADHDRRRRFRDGRGSHAAVSRALHLLGQDRYRELFSGLLCTIDLDADPVGTYEALRRFSPPVVDFLLPHANWTVPPPGRAGGGGVTPYADWLISVFDHWYDHGHHQLRVRLLENVIRLLMGGQSWTDQVGLSPSGVVVIDTDGSIEQGDALKSAYPGAPATGRNVFQHTFDEVLLDPGIRSWRRGVTELCPTCQHCQIRDVCGGGQYAHRYRSGGGFRSPSVYCPDLKRLIRHIRARVGPDLHAPGSSASAGDARGPRLTGVGVRSRSRRGGP